MKICVWISFAVICPMHRPAVILAQVALKSGPWREASMVMLAMSLGMGKAGIQQQTISYTKPRILLKSERAQELMSVVVEQCGDVDQQCGRQRGRRARKAVWTAARPRVAATMKATLKARMAATMRAARSSPVMRWPRGEQRGPFLRCRSDVLDSEKMATSDDRSPARRRPLGAVCKT